METRKEFEDYSPVQFLNLLREIEAREQRASELNSGAEICEAEETIISDWSGSARQTRRKLEASAVVRRLRVLCIAETGDFDLAHVLVFYGKVCSDRGLDDKRLHEVTLSEFVNLAEPEQRPEGRTVLFTEGIAVPSSKSAECDREAFVSTQKDPAYSPDFRSVSWFGKLHSFTANQAVVVKTLWEAWKQGVPDVGDATLLEAVDHAAPPSSLRNLFRDHDAWGTMIVAGGSKGAHRLAEPEESLHAEYIA